MISEPVTAVYKGEGIVRLHGHFPQLQENQDLLVTIVAIPPEHQADKTQPSPLEYFRQIVSKLHHYEQKYGITSEEFHRQFQSGVLPEGPFDYFDWRVLYNGYRHMQKRFGFSREQIADA